MFDQLRANWESLSRKLSKASLLESFRGSSLMRKLRPKKGSDSNEPRRLRSPSEPSYNNGFGDFCFGRALDAMKNFRMPSPSHCIYSESPIVELDGFIRTGVFRFFDLPFTIRAIVFDYWCYPVYVGPGPYIQYKFLPNLSTPWIDYESVNGWWNGSFEDCWVRFNQGQEDFQTAMKRLTPKQRQQEKIKAKERQSLALRSSRKHPDRSGKYVLDANYGTKWDDNRDEVLEMDISDLSLIRKLSHVSCQFRYELGLEIWHSARLSPEVVTYGTSRLLSVPQLCYDRPLACQMVRHIDLFLDLLSLPDIELDPHPFHELLSVLVSTFRLDTLYLKLLMYEDDVIELANGGGLLQMLVLFRSVPVSGRFEFWGGLRGQNAQSGIDDYNSPMRRILLRKDEEKIKNLLMPDSLRVPETEMSRYLASRKQLLKEVAENGHIPIIQTFEEILSDDDDDE